MRSCLCRPVSQVQAQAVLGLLILLPRKITAETQYKVTAIQRAKLNEYAQLKLVYKFILLAGKVLGKLALL